MNLTPSPTPPPLPPISSPLEDKQTLALIRRVLRPQSSPNSPLEDILPALTSSPSVDIQLYAFLAIVCRDFIFAWYSKITNDRTFVDEIIKVIAHTTRSLEQRLRHINLEVLLLDELPALLDNHVRGKMIPSSRISPQSACSHANLLDYRQCVYRHRTALCPHLSLPEIFHNLQPHPALKSSPESEHLYLKLLSSGILATLLPTEDLQSNCERTLIREILSGLVLWNAVDKLSEPWMVYDIIAKVLGTPQQVPADSGDSIAPSEVVNSGDDSGVSRKDELRKMKRRKSRHERRSSKQVLMKQLTAASSRTTTPVNPTPPATHPISISRHIEHLLGLAALLINLAATVVTSIYTFMSHPPPPPRRKKPILRMSFLKFISNLLRLDSNQPWLKGNLLLVLSPFAIQPAGSLIDSLLSDLFKAHIASPDLVVKVLASARAALFPNGAMGPPRPYPTAVEQDAIREAAMQALLDKIPTVIKRHYFGTEQWEWRSVIDGYLDILKEREVNKHLIYQVLELVVVRLVPELEEVEVRKLMRERIGAGDV
ncbi:PXA domain-containing protein [Tirmania nivea]|nr:PXA domain-containing protein [Tirmania nivea]